MAALEPLPDNGLPSWGNASLSSVAPAEFNMGGWDSPLGLGSPRVLVYLFRESVIFCGQSGALTQWKSG